MITQERLQEIENAANRAYPGPWFNSYGDIVADYISGGEDEPAMYATEIGQIVSSPEDAIFVPLARAAVPELLAEVKDYHALRAYYRGIEEQLRHTQARLDYEESEVKRLQAEIDSLMEQIGGTLP